jgi:hypothetical protein
VTRTLGLAALATVVALVLAAPAAAEPCWQRVISDWSDGRIDNVYSPSCYRGAIAHLPANADSVSTAPRDLERGLERSLAAPPSSSGTSQASTTPVWIVIAAAGAFLLLSTARMVRGRRQPS